MSCMRIFKLTPKKVMNYRKTLRKRGRMLESEQNSKKGLATYHMYVTHKYRVFFSDVYSQSRAFVQELNPSHKAPKYSDCLLAEDELK